MDADLADFYQALYAQLGRDVISAVHDGKDVNVLVKKRSEALRRICEKAARTRHRYTPEEFWAWASEYID